MIICWTTAFVLLLAYLFLFRHIRSEDETWYIKKTRLVAMWFVSIVLLFLPGLVVDDSLTSIANYFGIEPVPDGAGY